MMKDLTSALYQAAELTPERQLYSFLGSNGEKQNLTNSELLKAAQFFAEIFTKLTHENDIIVLSLKPSLKFIELTFGCILAKRTFLPVYPMRSPHDIARTQALLNKIPAALIVTDFPYKEKDKALFRCPVIPFYELEGLPATKKNSRLELEIEKEDHPIFLQASSGTTRGPRAIIINSEALMACLQNMQEALSLSYQDIGSSWLPPYHDMGLIGAIFLPLFADFPVYLMKPSSFAHNPMSWIQALSDYQVSVTAAPNFAYDLCCSRFLTDSPKEIDLSHLRRIVNSAEMLRSKTLHRFYDTFKPYGLKWDAITPAYGLAEATLMGTSNPLNQGPCIRSFSRDALHEGVAKECPISETNGIDLTSSGKPIKNMDCIIVDRETLLECQPYNIGEIWVKGSSLTSGYFYDEQGTKYVYTSVSDELSHQVAYVRTGDTGFMDKQGYLFVTGRLKDTIKTAHGLVSAEEIEEIVDQSLGFDALYATAALMLADQDKTEIVVLKEVPRGDSYTAHAQLIYEHIRKLTAVRINKVVFVRQGQIPRTTSGKIKRHVAIVLFKYNLLEVSAIKSFSEESLIH